MGYCYLSRRIPYEPGFEEQQGVYPIGTNGMPEGDIYIPEDINKVGKIAFDENDYLFYRMFCIMYNHGNQQFFKDLFNK